MQEELRKVRFNLNEHDLNLGDLDYKDPNGIMAERYGFFHRWGDIVCYDSQTERKFQKTIAIVEEIGMGKIFEIVPHCITFL